MPGTTGAVDIILLAAVAGMIAGQFASDYG
jgi:hypothetical protein